jgi:hypothetical protein
MLICDSYNSAVFSSIAVNNYFAMSVSESFFKSNECQNCNNLTTTMLTHYEKPIRHMYERAHNNELEKLTNADCLTAYAEMLQTKRGSVLLVASDDKMPPVDATLYGGTQIYALNPVAATTSATSQSAADIYCELQCNTCIENWGSPLEQHTLTNFETTAWMCSSIDLTKRGSDDPCLNLIGEVKSKPNDWQVSAPSTLLEATNGVELPYSSSTLTLYFDS